MRKLLLLFMLSLICFPLAAQDEPVPEVVQTEATDGLVLVGDFYQAQTEADTAPAVLLMHQYRSNRHSWSALISELVTSGYHVVAVDLRGHGDTGGDSDWELSISDVQTWLDWMRQQPQIDPDHIAIIGASIGSNLALVGCANDERCVTAIALSPGLDFFGVQPETSVSDGLSERSALIVAAQRDETSADALRQLVASAEGEVGSYMLPSSAHGIATLTNRHVIPLMLYWLDTHLSD